MRACWGRIKKKPKKKKQPKEQQSPSPTLLTSSNESHRSHVSDTNEEEPVVVDRREEQRKKHQENEDKKLIEKLQEVNITKLKEKHHDMLGCKLNDETCPGVDNWKHIAEILIADKEKRKDTIEDISNGKKNPGLIFLRVLHSKAVTLNDFKDKTESERRDIHKYITNIRNDNDILIGDLTLIQLEEIARNLNKTVPGVFGWRHFADMYQFDDMTKRMIGNGVEPTFSPTKRLFEILPEFGISKLSDVYNACKRNDVKEDLKKIAENLTNNGEENEIEASDTVSDSNIETIHSTV